MREWVREWGVSKLIKMRKARLIKLWEEYVIIIIIIIIINIIIINIIIIIIWTKW